MPTTAAKITVRHADTNYGPYTLDECNRLLVSGRLLPNDLAWVEGTPEWTRLGHVEGTVRVPPTSRDGRARGPASSADSDRRILPAFLLAFFLGVFGIHRFYVGKTGSGIAMLVLTLTFVGFFVTAIWATVDWILLACGVFRDAQGRTLTDWT